MQEAIYWKLDPMKTYGDWTTSVCIVCYVYEHNLHLNDL